MPAAHDPSPSTDPYAVVRRLLSDASACPSCATALTSTRCSRCGLDLSGPDARELWSLSQAAATALGARQTHLAGMRARQTRPPVPAVAPRPAPLAAAFPAPVAPAGPRLGHSSPPAPPRTAPAAPGSRSGSGSGSGSGSAQPLATPPAGPPGEPARPPAVVPPVPREPRRRPRWRVQTVLQVLGASLLAAASIVFLLFSWGWIPLAGRAVAVAVGTVVVFATASRLRRSGLTSSAEAVGGLAAVLLLLDAWAVPATGLVRFDEPAVYASVATLACGAGLVAWGRRARLRVGTLAGAVLVPVAPLLLAPLTGSRGGLAGLACVALALTTVRFAGAARTPGTLRAERLVLAATAWALTAGAVLVALTGVLHDGTSWTAPAPGAGGSVAALVVVSVVAGVQGRLAWRTAASTAPHGARAGSRGTGPRDGQLPGTRADGLTAPLPARPAVHRDDPAGAPAPTAAGSAAADGVRPSDAPPADDPGAPGVAQPVEVPHGSAPAPRPAVPGDPQAPVVVDPLAAFAPPQTSGPAPADPAWTGEPGGSRPWATVAGAVAALAATAGVVVLARAGLVAATALWALLPGAATVVALALDLGRRRSADAPWPTQGARCVALLAGVPTVAALPVAVAAALVDPDVTPDAPTVLALLAGAAAVVALSRVGGWLPRTGSWVAVGVLGALPVAVACVAPGTSGAGTVALFLVVAALAYAGDATGRRPVVATSAPTRTLAVLAVLGSLAASRGDLGPLAVALAGAAALTTGTRPWLVRWTRLRAAALTAGVLLAWTASTVLLLALGSAAAVAVSATGCAALAGSVALAVRRAGTAPDRLAWLSAAVVVLLVAWPWAADASTRDDAGATVRALLVLLAVLATAAAATVAARGRAVPPRTRAVAALGFAPLGALTVTSLELAARGALPGSSLAVGVAAAGSAGVLLAPVLARVPRPRTEAEVIAGSAEAGSGPADATVATAEAGAGPADAGLHEPVRRAAEWSGWAVLAAAVATASAPRPVGSAATVALVLLVGALTAAAWSLAPGRGWARWWTLALATVASWVLLAAGDVGTPEAYLAPVGLVLAAVGARRVVLRAAGDVPLVAAGLALATVPSALLAGELVTRVPRHAVAAAAAVLLVGAAVVPVVRRHPGAGTSPLRPVHVLLLLGASLATLGPWRHAVLAAQAPVGQPSVAEDLLRVEAWSLPAAVLVALAVGRLAADPSAAHLRARAWAPWLSAAGAAVPTVVAVTDSALGLVRTLTVLAGGAALALGTARRPAAARSDADVALVGLGVAGLGAVAGAVTLSAPPADVLLAAFGLLALVVAVLRAAPGAGDGAGRGAAAPWWGGMGAALLLPLTLGAGAWRGVSTAALAAALVAGAAVVRRSAPAGTGTGAQGTPSTGPLDPHSLLVVTAAALALLGPARLALVSAAGTRPDLHVEAWCLGAAGLLAFALRETTRRAGSLADLARHGGAWLVAAVAFVPPAVAAASVPSLARSLGLLAVGAALAIAGVTGSAPPRRVLSTSLVPLGLGVAALAWSASVVAPSTPPAPVYLAALGVLTVGVGAVSVTRTDPGAAWPFAGGVLVVPLVLGPAPWGGPLVGLVIAAAALGGGALAGSTPARSRGRAVALVTATGLGVVVAARHTAAAAGAGGGAAVEAVALVTATVLAAALVLGARSWPFGGPHPRVWGAWPVALAATLPSLAAAADDPSDVLRPAGVLAAGSVLAVLGAARVTGRRATSSEPAAGTSGLAGSGAAPGVEELGGAARTGQVAATQLRAVGLVLASAAALLLTVRGGAVPGDLPLVLLGATLLAVGALALRGDATASSWTCLGAGLALALVVPVLTGWSEPTTWRLLLALTGATAAVVVGAVRRWQAPFVLGAGALAVVAVVQASPAAVAAMQVVEWWVVLALGGGVLLGLGLTYERRLHEAREAVRFVAAMR